MYGTLFPWAVTENPVFPSHAVMSHFGAVHIPTIHLSRLITKWIWINCICTKLGLVEKNLKKKKQEKIETKPD